MSELGGGIDAPRRKTWLIAPSKLIMPLSLFKAERFMSGRFMQERTGDV